MADTDYTDEIWRAIPDWEGILEISSLGRTRSLDRILECSDGSSRSFKGKIKRPVLNKVNGYWYLGMRRPGVNIQKTLHSLVCSAFHGKRPLNMEAAHRDGNKSNNSACNLRWATRRENENDKEIHGTRLRGEKIGNSKLTEADVIAIRSSPLTSPHLAPIYGVSARHIRGVRSGKNGVWRHV